MEGDTSYNEKTNELTIEEANGVLVVFYPVNPEDFQHIKGTEALNKQIYEFARRHNIVGTRRGH